MLRCEIVLLCGVLLMWAADAHAQANCVAKVLTEQQIKDIITKQREVRNDLPVPFAEQTSVIRRQGCHYLYIEHPVPPVPDKQNIFMVNQHGVIVDTQPATMECPKRVFTDSELADIVKRARAEHKGLPAPLAKFTTRVDRMRCLYLYFEEPVPPLAGEFQVFTIDPFGELIEAYRNKR